MTKRLGVIGYPLGHTLSPVFQQAGLDAIGLDATFEAWPTPPEELAQKVERFRSPDYLGICVTLPHKQAVIPLLDSVDVAAQEIGAVNWIINREGKLTGYNTDAPGFLRALKEELDFDPEGKRALVVGAGGAARAIVYALRSGAVADLVIANRTVGRANDLVAHFRREGWEPKAIGLDRAGLEAAARSADLIVNTSSVGMAGGPNPDASPIPPAAISPQTVVYDIVYAPAVTPLLRDTLAAGARGATGLSMLVYQGVIGFELSTGREAPADVMMKAAREGAAARH